MGRNLHLGHMQDCDGNGNWGMLTAWIPFYAENGNNLAISAKKEKKRKNEMHQNED